MVRINSFILELCVFPSFLCVVEYNGECLIDDAFIRKNCNPNQSLADIAQFLVESNQLNDPKVVDFDAGGQTRNAAQLGSLGGRNGRLSRLHKTVMLYYVHRIRVG